MKPPFSRPSFNHAQSGVTLTELMVAVAVMSIGVLGLVGSFAAIQQSMQLSKNKTLATNLAQEKLHILMQKTYHQVLVTPDPSGTNTDFPANFSYDNTYFPPENILQGGVVYTRYTYIRGVRENSGVLDFVSPTTPDTGMRQITVTVVWSEANVKKKMSLISVLANPDSVMGVSGLNGKVKIVSTATGIPGALVLVAENQGWRDSTNATGDYNMIVSPGAATLLASAPGYYPKYVDVVAVANAGVTTDIELVPIASGTVSGTAWMHPGLVISQVVVSTVQADSGYIVQYVELFNPTTGDITIGGDPPPVKLNLRAPATCTGSVTCAHATYGVKLVYVNNVIDAGGYYVIANTTTFTVAGTSVAADAYFDNNAHTYCSPMPSGAYWVAPTMKQLLLAGHGGAVWLTDAGDDTIDAVGWSHAAQAPSNFETDYLTLATGLGDGAQVIRTSSPSFVSNAFGRAYDSGRTTADVTTMTITYAVIPSTDSTVRPIIAGVPAVGAVVSANDGLSVSSAAYSIGSPPRAIFTLPHVATGSWSVLISSGTRLKQQNGISIASTGSTFVFPSSTTRLVSSGTYGYITGTVTDADGVALSGISVSPGSAGSAQTTGANGRYWLSVAPGPVDVTANPSNANPTYVSLSSSNVNAVLGQIKSGVDFTLSKGGRFTGFVSRDGVNALPGIAISANDVNEISRDVQVSDVNGRFLTINVATGTYELVPAIDSLETSTPTYITRTVTAGQTVDVGTFTITGALGTISGAVTASGAPIATGVLIVVTTRTLSGTPPAPPNLSTGSLSSSAYYLTSSREDGTYSVDVRQSTNPLYNIYGYYYATNNTGSSAATSRTRTAGVLSGQTTGQHNLAW
ncbi:MAG: prepilin-type N-terminal cleavage/methylation domain-containing protein [Elusimicrobiota bacterium]|nr:MAG: prepilin-type N-terminal cleavage/methylation domain-containing protein [Elusimicrobiota bacterium]